MQIRNTGLNKVPELINNMFKLSFLPRYVQLFTPVIRFFGQPISRSTILPRQPVIDADNVLQQFLISTKEKQL
jgi:hypothetical protein